MKPKSPAGFDRHLWRHSHTRIATKTLFYMVSLCRLRKYGFGRRCKNFFGPTKAGRVTDETQPRQGGLASRRNLLFQTGRGACGYLITSMPFALLAFTLRGHISPPVSIFLLQIIRLLNGFALLSPHLCSFMPKIDKTITIMPLSMPRGPFIVITTDDSFLPHIFDDEKVRARVLKAFEPSIVIGNMAHPLSPICNTVVSVFENLRAEDADSLGRRTMIKEVGDSVGDIGVDLSRMKA